MKALGYSFTLANMDYIDISSTELRHRIHDKKDAKEIIPKKVLEYIKEHDLYRN